jgi:transposase-like protein
LSTKTCIGFATSAGRRESSSGSRSKSAEPRAPTLYSAAAAPSPRLSRVRRNPSERLAPNRVALGWSTDIELEASRPLEALAQQRGAEPHAARGWRDQQHRHMGLDEAISPKTAGIEPPLASTPPRPEVTLTSRETVALARCNDFLRPGSGFRNSGGFRSSSRVPAVAVSARAARGSRRGRGRVRSVPGSPAQ